MYSNQPVYGQSSPEWASIPFVCNGDCCIAWCCPCISIKRISDRVKYSAGGAFAFSVGLLWVLCYLASYWAQSVDTSPARMFNKPIHEVAMQVTGGDTSHCAAGYDVLAREDRQTHEVAKRLQRLCAHFNLLRLRLLVHFASEGNC